MSSPKLISRSRSIYRFGLKVTLSEECCDQPKSVGFTSSEDQNVGGGPSQLASFETIKSIKRVRALSSANLNGIIILRMTIGAAQRLQVRSAYVLDIS